MSELIILVAILLLLWFAQDSEIERFTPCYIDKDDKIRCEYDGRPEYLRKYYVTPIPYPRLNEMDVWETDIHGNPYPLKTGYFV